MIDAHRVEFTVNGTTAAIIEEAAVRIAAAYFGDQDHDLRITASPNVEVYGEEAPVMYEAHVTGNAR